MAESGFRRMSVTVHVASRNSARHSISAWAAILTTVSPSGEVRGRRVLSGTVPGATANACLLRAAADALSALRMPCAVEFRCGLPYLADGARALPWRRKSNWVSIDPGTGEPKPVANARLWREVVEAVGLGGHTASWIHANGYESYEITREAGVFCKRPVGDRIARVPDDDAAGHAAAAALAGSLAVLAHGQQVRGPEADGEAQEPSRPGV